MGLRIYLLGQFKLQANGRAIDLPSRTAQSLLAYLALNAGVTQRREKLSSLLWPEASESNARSYLRQALWRIHKSLESGGVEWEDYLKISELSVTFDEESEYWLDAEQVLDAAEGRGMEELKEAVYQYRGELLPGFYDEWVVVERERLQAAYHQRMSELLDGLIEAGGWDEVLKWGEEWIRLGYGPEAAYRGLMIAYAELGDQGKVRASYQRCVEAMERELGLGPSEETQRLYEQLRRGEMEGGGRVGVEVGERRPAFLEGGEGVEGEKAVFVAREGELARLEWFLRHALGGDGKMIFITGEAGSGKTALVQEFSRRAQEAHADMIVASGNCNAYTGIGDPYLPFREILELLAGEAESRWAAGAITREHARRLWKVLPETGRALVEAGPDLIDTFVPGKALIERAGASALGRAEWLDRLKELVERRPSDLGMSSPQQSDLFEQYARVLRALAQGRPMLLVLDDLQWADLGSISLLFHLGRRMAGSRILIVGAYRPEEVGLGRDGERHPLEAVVNELQREYGEIVVDVDQAERRVFLEAMLDSEPNRLGVPFRDMLYRQTRGHPLFTIELLRGLQERGDLVQDQEGCWVEGPALDWETLPARVEAVIAERIGRLAEPLQAVLRVASVEGDVFTAEAAAHVLGIDERTMVARLSSELDRRHRLVGAQAIERLGSRRVSRYRFRHSVFQMYLYDNMDKVERAYLHEDLGNALEELYGDQSQEIVAIAPQLARHFVEAEMAEKAIHYLHKAGQKAVQLSAYQEALPHLTRGLELLMNLPISTQRDQQELALQLGLGMAWIGIAGAASQELKEAYLRARELCQQVGETRQLSQVLGELSLYYYVRAEHQKARELGEEALSLAEQIEDPLLVALGHWYTGVSLFALGEFTTARAHLQEVIAFYKPGLHHRAMVYLRGSDAGVSALAYDACCLWCLGYPDQAMSRSQEALALARELDHPFSLADTVCYAGCLLNAMRRDAQALLDSADELLREANEKVPTWTIPGTGYRGEGLAMLGQVQEGIALMRQAVAAGLSKRERCYMTETLCALVEAQVKSGQLEGGQATLDEAFSLVEETDERFWEVEHHRLRVELLLMQGDEEGAEAGLERAREVASRQSAKSLELRAAIDLARLWRKQGKPGGARQSLGEIYNWFTEGFDTPDLVEARALLEELDQEIVRDLDDLQRESG